MFGKKKTEDNKPVPAAEPAANENAPMVGVSPAEISDEKPAVKAEKQAKQAVHKDKPRPFSIFRHEAGKTAAVKEQSTQERKAVDEKLNGLSQSYKPALENYDKELKAAGEERLRVRKETVDNLTGEVAETRKAIADLEKQLAAQREKLSRSSSSLSRATKDLKTETSKVTSENKAAFKARKKELSDEISTARKARKEVYSKTGKKLRTERWNTFKRTTKETVAVVPDLTFRFLNAARRSVTGVFSNAKKGYEEPTLFSVKRDEPLTTPAPKKKAQPKPPAQ